MLLLRRYLFFQLVDQKVDEDKDVAECGDHHDDVVGRVELGRKSGELGRKFSDANVKRMRVFAGKNV